MYLERLKLINFRNYETQELAFSPHLNLVAGLNGMGKTNLLDAVYYTCMGKSHFTNTDRNVVRHGEAFFRLEGYFFLKNKTEKIVAKVQPGKTKTLERNDNPYPRLADHVGLLPVVFKTPDDTALALDGSEERRRFLDNTLCQIDVLYLQHLMQYNKVLQKRNAQLKQFGEQHFFDITLLEVFDQQLLEPAAYIFEKRKKFVAILEPIFNQHYQVICAGQESVKCFYRSQLNDNPLIDLLKENREKDRILQRTTAGIHRDDLSFKNEWPCLKNFCIAGAIKVIYIGIETGAV